MKQLRFEYIVCLFLALASASPATFALQITHSDSSTISLKKTRVTPGIEYDAGWLHRLFAGAHWRDLWTTEFEAEFLDLDHFAGGLTPIRKGGGLQTKNLRLMGNDGREYKFRSMNKDGARALPPELQESVIADIYQDQISIGNPMAALVVPSLLNAVGVLNAEPRIVVMPSSTRLASFNDEFAGVLGMIEEHPKAGFRGADNVIDGFEIFEKLNIDPDEKIDEREFLKARLMDILMGDRDRHADQWRWAGYKLDGKTMWRPIPRDRDFAFGRYDGIFPSLAGLFAHSVVGFGESYPSILELTWIGRHLDRRFLNGLDKSTWDSMATYIQSTLSDSVMRLSLQRMPPEMYQRAGEQMFRMLKARRDKLNQAANEFYGLLAEVVDVFGTDKAERAEIQQLNDNLVQVNLFKKKSGAPISSRIFSSETTKEIRICLLGGNDVATVEGDGKNNIRVRILGGEGDDEFTDKTKTAGTEFYDDTKTTISAGPKTSVVTERADTLFDEKTPEPKIEDRYLIVRAFPLLSFNADDGIIFGGLINFTQYGFRANPHAHYASIRANYAPQQSRYDVRLFAESYKIISGARTELTLSAGNLGLSGFYGLGNETPRTDSLDDVDFYRANYHSILVEPAVNVNISEAFLFRFATRFEYTNAKVTKNNLLDIARPYGLGNHSAFALSVGFSFDKRDNPLMPSKGVFLSGNGIFYPALLGYDFAFGKVGGDFRAFFPAPSVVFALHVGGEKTFGTYPFYQASTIGSINTVRGFPLGRFAGDASLFGQAEMRVALGQVNLFVPGTLGLSLFSDGGRVFLRGESSTQWHSAFGGGLWINFVNMFLLNLSAAKSTEELRLYLTAGFGF